MNTEHLKQAERERYRTLLAAIPDIIMEVDARKVYTWANEAGLRFFGPDVVGREAADYFVGEQDTYRQVAPLFAGQEETFYLESWQRRQDGQVRLLAWWCRVLKDERGEVIGALSTARDITEDREREEEARKNEARLESLLRISKLEGLSEKELLDRVLDEAIALTGSAIGYIYHYDEETRRFSLNTWSRDVMAICSVQGPTGIYDLDKTGIWGEAVRQGRPIMVNDFAAPNPLKKGYPEGHAPLSRFLTIPVRLGQRIVAVVGVANKASDYDEKDVRQLQLLAGEAWRMLEQRRANQVVVESEARYRLLADHISDVIWTADLTPRLTYVSPSQERLTGFTPEETLALPLERVMTPESLHRILALLAEELGRVAAGDSARGRMRTFELEQFRKDGSTIWVEMNATFLTDAAGTPSGIVGVSRDISERRRLQASVAQADRLASMGLLAAGVAHEINNPLSYVLLNLESCTEDIERLSASLARIRHALVEGLGEEKMRALLGDSEAALGGANFADLVERFREALSGARRIRDISRGLGTFARVEKDTLSPVDLRYSIEAAINIAFNEIRFRARLVKDLGPVEPVLASDGRLSQVFLNLLINAAHAIREGDVEQNKIEVRTWQDGTTVCAVVEDTGCGIPPENLERIFEPFFTTKPVGVGSGLGLNITRNIVQSYGGTISVESQVGAGTRFVIRLPAASGAAPARGESLTKREGSAIRGRLLIIDDEPGIRGALKRILRQHEIVEADGGEAGRQILETDQGFDVILCDMMMPRMSGIDLHRWVLERHPALSRKMVFMTGGAFTPEARAYLEKVDNLQVEKPFDATNLRKMVAEWVAAARGAQK